MEDLSAKEMVLYSNRGGDFGIKGYYLAKTCELDKPHSSKWPEKPPKRPNFLDDVTKISSRNSTSAYYEVSKSMIIPTANHASSRFSKSPRVLISEDIMNFNKKNLVPGPGGHSPLHIQVDPKVRGAFELTSDREKTSYI